MADTKQHDPGPGYGRWLSGESVPSVEGLLQALMSLFGWSPVMLKNGGSLGLVWLVTDPRVS